MSIRLTRWQWARRKVGASWRDEIAGGLLAGVIFYFAGMRKELGALAVGLGAALAIALLKFAWHFSRARIEQDREQLAGLVASLGDLKARLEAVEARKPRVTTRIDGEAIVVRNEGAPARFVAQIQILSRTQFDSGDSNRRYQGYWDSPECGSALILSGHEARLILGGPRIPGSPGHPIATLTLVHFEPFHAGTVEISQAYFIESDPPQRNPELTVQVILSSEPELSAGALSWKYRLTTAGLERQH
jgi:hypothetical protein